MHLTMGVFAMTLVGGMVLLVGAVPSTESIVGWRLPRRTILWQLRLPRVLLAGLVGGGLALAGACVQGLFRNPLADPALIGVAGGAALAAASVSQSRLATGKPLVDRGRGVLGLTVFTGS